MESLEFKKCLKLRPQWCVRQFGSCKGLLWQCVADLVYRIRADHRREKAKWVTEILVAPIPTSRQCKNDAVLDIPVCLPLGSSAAAVVVAASAFLKSHRRLASLVQRRSWKVVCAAVVAGCHSLRWYLVQCIFVSIRRFVIYTSLDHSWENSRRFPNSAVSFYIYLLKGGPACSSFLCPLSIRLIWFDLIWFDLIWLDSLWFASVWVWVWAVKSHFEMRWLPKRLCLN